MKWYNKPITWKGYGIMCLAALALSAVNIAGMLLKPNIFLKPYEWLSKKFTDRTDMWF